MASWNEKAAVWAVLVVSDVEVVPTLHHGVDGVGVLGLLCD